jgi:hypothetical protein
MRLDLKDLSGLAIDITIENEARVMMARVAMARSGSALDVAEAPAGA